MTFTIGLVSPGAMGTAVGAAALSNGHTVIYAGDDRSASTVNRAEAVGLSNCGTLLNLCNQSDIIMSICPPHEATQLANEILDNRFGGTFVDCNAIAPSATRSLAVLFSASHFVDGGIIGGPPTSAEDQTTLYLSGAQAEQIAAVFEKSALNTNVLSTEIGQASALKMVFAAYTKGTTALLAAIIGVAEKEGVRQALETQWGETFTQQTHQRLTSNSAKAWRFKGEMEEIAETFAMAGFPTGFHDGAADIFQKLAGFKDNPAQDIDALISELTKPEL